MGHKQYCVLPPPGGIRIRLGPCRTFLCFKSAYITDIPVCENPTFTAGLNDSALKMETERHLQIRDFVRKLMPHFENISINATLRHVAGGRLILVMIVCFQQACASKQGYIIKDGLPRAFK